MIDAWKFYETEKCSSFSCILAFGNIKRNIILEPKSARDTFRVEQVQFRISNSFKRDDFIPPSLWVIPFLHP